MQDLYIGAPFRERCGVFAKLLSQPFCLSVSASTALIVLSLTTPILNKLVSDATYQ